MDIENIEKKRYIIRLKAATNEKIKEKLRMKIEEIDNKIAKKTVGRDRSTGTVKGRQRSIAARSASMKIIDKKTEGLVKKLQEKTAVKWDRSTGSIIGRRSTVGLCC